MQNIDAWRDDQFLTQSSDHVAGQTPWLKDARFDSILLLASVVIVPLVLLAGMGASTDAINPASPPSSAAPCSRPSPRRSPIEISGAAIPGSSPRRCSSR